MNVVNRICADLGLPCGDEHTQDWVYELPEQYRTRAWLDKYVEAYAYGNYSSEEKRELMKLALDVSNDLVSSGTALTDASIAAVLHALFDDYPANKDLVEYWALDGEPLEDCFALTAEIRRLKERVL